MNDLDNQAGDDPLRLAAAADTVSPAKTPATGKELAGKLLLAVSRISSQCGESEEDLVNWLTDQGGLAKMMIATSVRTTNPDPKSYLDQVFSAHADDVLAELRRKAAAYDAINTPEISEFLSAVENEALHQREHWDSNDDAGKTDADWFWLVGFLAGKAIFKPEKAQHHIITTAAALLNWHAHKIGAYQRMRPGIGPEKQPPRQAEPAAQQEDQA